jgi:hypothetical protein
VRARREPPMEVRRLSGKFARFELPERAALSVIDAGERRSGQSTRGRSREAGSGPCRERITTHPGTPARRVYRDDRVDPLPPRRGRGLYHECSLFVEGRDFRAEEHERGRSQASPFSDRRVASGVDGRG